LSLKSVANLVADAETKRSAKEGSDFSSKGPDGSEDSSEEEFQFGPPSALDELVGFLVLL
jgi:hypothetical protein